MPDLAATRRSLHALAELVLAGPQYAVHREIALTVTPDGFSTVREPQLVITGTTLVTPAEKIPLDGRTIADVAAEAGVVLRGLDDVYSDGSGLTVDHLLEIDPDAAAEIVEAFQRGFNALREFAPGETPILWPEHFDVGITVDEVNFGVSPGDGHLAVPYAYVGPWSRDGLEGEFWNAPFGSAKPVAEIHDLVAYFAEGARKALARNGSDQTG